LLNVIAEVEFRIPTQKPARGKIRPLGCRELRAPTWRNLTSLYAARPPLRTARIGALINFIPPHVQGFWFLSSVAEAISAVSPSPVARSNYEYFIVPLPGRESLDGFSDLNRAGQWRLSLRRFDKNPEQFGVETGLKTPNPY
jgi:hypothetical protein